MIVWFLRCCRAAAPALVLLWFWTTSPALADSLASGWSNAKQSMVRLLADPVGGGHWRLGLQFRLQPGWKTYWRSPGDAGLPATVDWSGTRGIVVESMDWPAPTRSSLQGFETFGYEDEVVLPVRAHVTGAGPVHLAALVDYLVCREVCLPSEAHLTLDLPATDAARPWQALLDSWVARVPIATPPGVAAAGIRVSALAAGGVGKDGFLDVTATADPPLLHPDVMIEGLALGVPARPQQSVAPSGDMVLHLPVAASAGFDLAKLIGQSATVTIVDPPRAVTVALPVTKPVAPPARSAGFGVSILLTALLGGFILNFMPCVLPVLSIKVLAVLGSSEASVRHWRAGFLAAAAGIVATFLVLAALLAVGKEAGLAMGWGIQFQQPVFLAALAAVTTGFAANLFGLFEVAVPSAIAAVLSNRAPRPAGHISLAGSFMTGILATVLATPCSAPFLGTAVGFGLAGSIGDIFAIFLCLGLGLAAPYVLLAGIPWLGRFLPRPGKWMLTLRRLLGLPLLATAIWLISVIAGEAGMLLAAILGAIGLAALASLVLAARGVRSSSVALFLFLAMPLVALFEPPPASIPTMTADGIWQPFDAARIAGAVAAGKTVFVDVTAAWCLTCKANEIAVLDKDPVHARLARPGVIAMRADWTRPDPRIAALLAAFQRYGIPLYVVYGPGMPRGTALPEIVTPALVTAALDKAGSTPDP